MKRSEDIGLFMEYSRLDETQFLFIMSLLRNCLQCLVYAQRLTFANVISYSGDREQEALRWFPVLQKESPGRSIFFSVNGQATKRRSNHTSGRATLTVEPIHFGNTVTRTAMPHIRVPLVFPSQKNRMASIKDFT